MSVLEAILAYKQKEVEARKQARPWGQIEDEAFSQTPPRDFIGALEMARGARR